MPSESKLVGSFIIFETLALGEFGTLYDCACTNVKLYVSNIMKLPTNLDSDGMNTKFFIFVQAQSYKVPNSPSAKVSNIAQTGIVISLLNKCCSCS